jgi:hypothetical protein
MRRKISSMNSHVSNRPGPHWHCRTFAEHHLVQQRQQRDQQIKQLREVGGGQDIGSTKMMRQPSEF